MNVCNSGARGSVPVARWSVFDALEQPAGAPTAAELGFVEPLLRRRLSPLAKMSLKVAHDCAHDLPSVRFVYASRHGDLDRTTAMLHDLAQDEPVSPTAFSMSVLNASAGLFSIIRSDMAPGTAVSASAESFGCGLLEAGLQLASAPEQPVLFVYADEPVPQVYGYFEPGGAHAIALLLQRDAPSSITWACTPGEHAQSGETQSRAFLRCLEPVPASAAWHGPGKSWCWHRQAA